MKFNLPLRVLLIALLPGRLAAQFNSSSLNKVTIRRDTLLLRQDTFYVHVKAFTNDTVTAEWDQIDVHGEINYNGSWKSWYISGRQRSEGTYSFGKKNDDWNYWDEAGNKMSDPAIPVNTMNSDMSAEDPPSFPGGDDAFLLFLQENVHYPDEAHEYNISGTVIVKFLIDTSGAILNPQIIQSLGYGCDIEALRVVSLMPHFIPAMQNGKKIKCYFKVPFNFIMGDVPEPKSKKNKN